MSTIATTAPASAVRSEHNEEIGTQRFGGIAAIAAAVVVISPLIVFGLVMPAFGLGTREAYATPEVIQAKWPLMMVNRPSCCSSAL